MPDLLPWSLHIFANQALLQLVIMSNTSHNHSKLWIFFGNNSIYYTSGNSTIKIHLFHNPQKNSIFQMFHFCNLILSTDLKSAHLFQWCWWKTEAMNIPTARWNALGFLLLMSKTSVYITGLSFSVCLTIALYISLFICYLSSLHTWTGCKLVFQATSGWINKKMYTWQDDKDQRMYHTW